MSSAMKTAIVFGPADLGSGIAAQSTHAADDIFRMLDPKVADLSPYRGEHRLVLIFADDKADVAYIEALEHLQAAEDGLRERDVLVLMDTTPSAQGKVREAVGAQGFTIALVGKDGEQKLSSDTLIPADELFDKIDAMPMRQAEMDD